MSDLGTTIFKRYGVLAILATIFIALSIWALAHYSAASGTEVSILWGLVRYTTSDQISGSSPSHLAAPTVDATPRANHLSISKHQVLPSSVDLKVIMGVAPTTSDSVRSTLRKERGLRELSPFEAGKFSTTIASGTYGFVFAGYIAHSPFEDSKIDRYPQGLPWFEVHFLQKEAYLLAFMTERDASSIAHLRGDQKYKITVVAQPISNLTSLVVLPTSRISSAEVREMQISPDYLTLALDLTLE